MSITNINPAAMVVNQPSTSTTYAQVAAPQSATDKGVQDFMNFMKESPALQMEDIWLAQHHLTRADLAKMTPEKRAAILKEMADDIKRATLQKAESGAGQ